MTKLTQERRVYSKRDEENDSESVGLCAGTRVLTQDGVLPVEYLHIGEEIITRNGPQTLRKIDVTFYEGVETITVQKNAIAAGSPEHEMHLAPQQPIYMRNWQARALTDEQMTTVSISQLINDRSIKRTDARKTRLYQLTFDAPEIICCDGIEMVTGPTPAQYAIAAE